MKKRGLSVLLCMVMILGIMPTMVFAQGTSDVWDGSVATEFAGGSGTESDPYQIATGAQLAYFARCINEYTAGSGLPDYRQTYVALTNDIDLNNNNWTPIGHTYSNYSAGQFFDGYFNGNGHTVSNMKIEITSAAQYTFWGFFGMLNGAIVERLNVSGAITNAGSITAIAANMIGGIVGYGCANLTDCTSDVDIFLTAYLNTCYVGGIFGNPQQCEIRSCVNTGDIICSGGGNPSVGGIGGCANGITIDSCENDGDIYVKSGRVGGIVAKVYTKVTSTINLSSSISNCCNNGNISTDTGSSFYVGGIAGEVTASGETITITNCISTGSVTDTTCNNNVIGEIYGPQSASSLGSLSVSNCYYLNEIDNANNTGSTKISSTDLASADFMNSLSGTDGKWAQNDQGQIVLAFQLADYTAVDAALNQIPADLSSYTDATVNALNDAQDAVVRNKMKSEQTTVDGYAEAIKNAITALVYKDADYSAVDEAIAKIPSDLSVYTDATVKALNDAKDAVVAGKKINEQGVVNGYATAIEDAINALEYKAADYTAVDTAIGKIPADLSIYTDETAKAVTDAKNAVIRGKNITEQQTVDGYATAINNAVASLEKKKVEPESPQTGDNSNMALWIALLFISGGAVTVLGISQKRKKAK